MNGTEKIKTLEELKETLNLQRKDKVVVFTNGCFDLLHLGHVRYLKNAKNLGGMLIVGVNSDQSVKKLKGEARPIVPQDERAEIVAALGCVDYVVIFSEDTPERLISELKPDVHVKGGNYSSEELPETELVKSYGGRVVIVRNEPGYSSSSLMQKILEKYVYRQ